MGSEVSNKTARNNVNCDELDSLHTYEQLLCMGFDDKLSFEASQKFKRNIDKSVEYITKMQNVINNKQNDHHHKMNNILNDNELNQECQSLERCLSIKRIKKLLIECGNNNKMNKYNSSNSITNILNDYIHIINVHDNDGNFEDIYNSLNIQCSLDKCKRLKRNQRDRMIRYNNNYNNNNNKNKNNLNVVMDDIMDQIHCYLLHSLDIGYRLNNTDKQIISNNKESKNNDNDEYDGNTSFTKMFNILNDRRKRFENIIGSQNRINQSKFVTKSDWNDEQKYNDNDDRKEDNNDNKNAVYSFSYRFDYWRNDDEDLYIQRKHKDLKDELLNNVICSIAIDEWLDVENKAKIFLKTNHAKRIKCCDTIQRWIRYYTFNNECFYDGASLSIHNLMVIILYTDFDMLSYKFSSTYRYKNNKENLKELILRHCNYYWMARYLRETVEGYGDVFSPYSKTKTYYHGISENMIFSSLIARFHHPTSTTKQITVAQRFATNNGIIINLERGACELPYFDCGWISAFGNEDESLFIGGMQPFEITNIINCSTGEEYKKYIKAINIVILSLDGGYMNYEGICAKDEALIDSLIINNNDQDIPSYILNFFNSYRNHVKCIKMCFGDLEESSYLRSLFLTNPSNVYQSFVNLKIIKSLFTKCKSITFSYDRNDKEKPILISCDYINQISSTLCEHQWDCLEKIEILNVNLDAEGVYDLINSSQKQFKQITKFNIRCKKQPVFGNCMYITRTE